jgi:hypothetical protein
MQILNNTGCAVDTKEYCQKFMQLCHVAFSPGPSISLLPDNATRT